MILIGRGLDLKNSSREFVGSFMVNFLCSFQGVVRGNSKPHRISGDNSLRDPPVPIPNTEVKPHSADGTWLETARESRSSPDSIFLSSSMAEHSAVNRRVIGSSPI